MPVLPLFQTPAHPDAWHRVTAPGGYEWWYFDGEDQSGRFQFVATWFEGFPLHPDYLRRYHRYRCAPTRHRPPLPEEFPCVYFAVYEEGRVLARFLSQYPAGAFSASADRPEVRIGPNEFAPGAGGTLRLRLDGSPCGVKWKGPRVLADQRLTGEFEFRPKHRTPAPGENCTIHESPGTTRRWIVANPPYDVKGTVQLHTGDPASNGSPGRTIEFFGSGYHDHSVSTAPFCAGPRQWVDGRVYSAGSMLAFQVTRPPGSTSIDEICLIEADTTGVRHVPTEGRIDWRRSTLFGPAYPERMIFGDRLRLSNPQVIDGTGGYARLAYDAQFSGRTGTAFCNVVQSRTLIRPVLAGLVEEGSIAADGGQGGDEPHAIQDAGKQANIRS